MKCRNRGTGGGYRREQNVMKNWLERVGDERMKKLKDGKITWRRGVGSTKIDVCARQE